MKILLINPIARRWALPNCAPLGLGYIAAVLKKAGHKVAIWDFNVYRDAEEVFFQSCPHDEFDLIGLTGIITQYREVKKLARTCKGYFPETPIVCGGALATSIPDLLLKKTKIDICVLGEGEKIIFDLLEDILSGDAIFNLLRYTEKNDFIKPIYDSSSILIKDLSTIPWPAYDLMEMNVYLKNPIGPYNTAKWKDGNPEKPVPLTMNVIGSRGCPAHCLQGDTLIDIIDKNEQCIKKPIKDLVGKIPLVLTRDPNTKNAVYTKPTRIFKTRENAELIRVHFTDKTYIDCTPDHRFMVLQYKNQFQPRKEWEIKAENLRPGQSVVAIKYPGQLKGHRTLIERILARKLRREEQIHHKDRNRKNNSPFNLKLTKNTKDHFSNHPEISQRMREDNPVFKLTFEERGKGGRKNKGKKRTQKQKERYRQSKLGIKNPNFGKDGPWKGKKRSQEMRNKVSQKLKGRIITDDWKEKIRQGNLGKKRTEEQKENYRKAWLKRKEKQIRIKNHKVLYIEKLLQREDVYCMELPGYDWFFANDILVHNCIYCFHNYMGQGYRVRPYNDIIMEICYLNGVYDVKYIQFVDDAFACSKKKILDFCKAFKGRGFEWSCAGRANIVDEEMVSEMAEAGCIGLWYGLESGSPAMLKAMDKGITIQQYEKAIELNRKYFRYEDYTFIVGTPGETDQTIRESIDFCKRNGIVPTAVFFMTPYPGTPLFKQLYKNDKGFKYVVDTDDLFEVWIESLGEQGEKMVWNCSGAPDEKVYGWHQRFLEETNAWNKMKH